MQKKSVTLCDPVRKLYLLEYIQILEVQAVYLIWGHLYYRKHINTRHSGGGCNPWNISLLQY
jgi:hypothetical protein